MISSIIHLTQIESKLMEVIPSQAIYSISNKEQLLKHKIWINKDKILVKVKNNKVKRVLKVTFRD